jgi:hypothetical protein
LHPIKLEETGRLFLSDLTTLYQLHGITYSTHVGDEKYIRNFSPRTSKEETTWKARHRWEDIPNLKMNKETSGSVKDGEFLDSLSSRLSFSRKSLFHGVNISVESS